MTISCIEPLGIGTQQFLQLQAHYADMGHNLRFYTDRTEEPSALVERMRDAQVVVVSNIPLPASLLEQCPSLRYLSVAFTGLDHIDLGYCQQHGIQVQNAAGYSTTAVSELAVGMMLDVLRNVTTLDGHVRQGQGRGSFLGRELRGKTVGIVGTGAIGMATARLVMAFGATVVAYSRTVRPEAEALDIKYMPLMDMLRIADIVSLHTPLTPQTRHLIAAEQLVAMKPTAILINTARGPVCDISAVANALNSGTIAGAAFDVFEHEPPIEADHPLLHAPGCLLTPHIAFATVESFAERAQIVFAHVDSWLAEA